MNDKPSFSVKAAVKAFNRWTGVKCLFKPGYPVGRNVWMCRTKDRHLMRSRIRGLGVRAVPLAGVGHDFNLNGDLYKISRIKEETR